MSLETDKNVSFLSLLDALSKHSASDLHLKPNRPPLYRIHGKLIPARYKELNAQQIQQLLFTVMSPALQEKLKKDLSLDFSFEVAGQGRFRANLFHQRGMLSAAIRRIPLEVPKLAHLGLPEILSSLALNRQGLLLFTGSTGAGKSTTMAGVLEHINENRYAHIVTIEDPIEFVYTDKKSTFSQKEIGMDSVSMQAALISALRQDPDVIAIGELRTYEALQTALHAAETGHLVITTLHTHDAVSTLNRILEMVPTESKNQTKALLASALIGIVCQKLALKKDQSDRVAVCEVLVNSPTVQTLILEEKISQIREVMESSSTYYKMQSFNQALEQLVLKKVISSSEALQMSPAPEQLKLQLDGLRNSG